MSWLSLSGGYLLGMGAWLLTLGWSLRWALNARRRWNGRPDRQRFIHVGLSVWMFAAGLTAVELYFALVYDKSDSLNTTNVSHRWYTRHVRLNPQGFRDVQPFAKVA